MKPDLPGVLPILDPFVLRGSPVSRLEEANKKWPKAIILRTRQLAPGEETGWIHAFCEGYHGFLALNRSKAFRDDEFLPERRATGTYGFHLPEGLWLENPGFLIPWGVSVHSVRALKHAA